MLRGDVPFPKVDGVVREKLLDLIESANPSLPDPNVPLRHEPLLFTSALQSYLDLYFTRFNTAYPLIHMPTFQTTSLEPLLLLSLLLLGATYSLHTLAQITTLNSTHVPIVSSGPTQLFHGSHSPNITPELSSLHSSTDIDYTRKISAC